MACLSGFVSLLLQTLVEMGVDSIPDARLAQIPSMRVDASEGDSYRTKLSEGNLILQDELIPV